MSDATANAGTTDIDAMGPRQLFDWLWQTKYGPEIVQTLRAESERRMHAFADDVTFIVCGEELRLMTPRDLHYLDRDRNAFVCSCEDITPGALQWFLWTLSVTNDGSLSWRNRWRKGRCYGRVSMREDLDADSSEVYAYIDRLWLDTPADEPTDAAGGQQQRKPPTTYCLAPLLANVAGAVGAIDPMSGRLLADTPIPRLLQYQRSALERKTGENEPSSFDSYRSRCLEEVNQIVAARRAK